MGSIFFKKRNVASENCSHLLKRKPRRPKCRFPVESRKSSKITLHRKKGKKIERKQKEMKVKNVVPLLVFLFLFSVVVFAFFVFFFFSLPIFCGRFSPQLANNDSHFLGGEVRMEFLKFGF